jgi:hypothetical protein
MLFASKPKTGPTRADALIALRSAIAGAVSAARQAGIDGREIAVILEGNADQSRQADAMSRPVL